MYIFNFLAKDGFCNFECKILDLELLHEGLREQGVGDKYTRLFFFINFQIHWFLFEPVVKHMFKLFRLMSLHYSSLQKKSQDISQWNKCCIKCFCMGCPFNVDKNMVLIFFLVLKLTSKWYICFCSEKVYWTSHLYFIIIMTLLSRKAKGTRYPPWILYSLINLSWVNLYKVNSKTYIKTVIVSIVFMLNIRLNY